MKLATTVHKKSYRLKPGQVVTAVPGSLTMMSAELNPTVEAEECNEACKVCCCAGGALFRLVVENKTMTPQFIALSPPQPGRIIPINLDRYNGITFIPGAFLGALEREWSYKVKLVNSSASGCCGHGIYFTQLYGKGTAFLHAMGTVQKIQLARNEQTVLSVNSLVAFERSVKYEVRAPDSCLMWCCGGVGLFHVVLTGPGIVFMQSLSIETLQWAIRPGGGNRHFFSTEEPEPG